MPIAGKTLAIVTAHWHNEGESKGGAVMIVRELLEAFSNQTVNREELSKQYNCSDKTITNKIKSLGFVWDRASKRHEYQGPPEQKEAMLNMDVADLFTKQVGGRKASEEPTQRKLPVSPDNSKQPTQAQNGAQDSLSSQLSLLDDLLNNKPTRSKAVYRGYYFDPDIIHVIDSTQGGNKSKLINEALRIVFKAKGLL